MLYLSLYGKNQPQNRLTEFQPLHVADGLSLELGKVDDTKA